jgi:hypothetical protein
MFYTDETDRCIVRSVFEAKRDQDTLREFASRLGATIVYIMIQSLYSKSKFPNRNDEQSLVDIVNRINIKGNSHYRIRGQDKDEIARKWVEKAIRPLFILFEFCRLPIVKRGLEIFGDIDIDDPYWSPHEMDQENFKKLTDAFKNAFPEINEKLDRLIKKEKERITRVEKERRKTPSNNS